MDYSDDILKIGCCGAYCKTCKAFTGNFCRGCKTGYANAERDLSKAKCKIKSCCMSHNYASCADCIEYPSCNTIQSLHNHAGYKYGKYKEAILFIIRNGYDEFLEIANSWTMQYGKYQHKH
jgi:hypothetical protein